MPTDGAASSSWFARRPVSPIRDRGNPPRPASRNEAARSAIASSRWELCGSSHHRTRSHRASRCRLRPRDHSPSRIEDVAVGPHDDAISTLSRTNRLVSAPSRSAISSSPPSGSSTPLTASQRGDSAPHADDQIGREDRARVGAAAEYRKAGPDHVVERARAPVERRDRWLRQQPPVAPRASTPSR
jgi:hypothetical protein